MRKPADSRFRYGPYTLPLVWGKRPVLLVLHACGASMQAGLAHHTSCNSKISLHGSAAGARNKFQEDDFDQHEDEKTWGNGSPKPGWSPHHVTRHPPGRGHHPFLRLSWWKNQHCNWPNGPRELWFVKFVCLKILQVFFLGVYWVDVCTMRSWSHFQSLIHARFEAPQVDRQGCKGVNAPPNIFWLDLDGLVNRNWAGNPLEIIPSGYLT